MADSSDTEREKVRQLFLPVGQNVVRWGNATEAEKTLPAAIDALDRFQLHFFHGQRPLVMQPLWKTKGKTPMLDEQAFDIFVWSDFALARVFINLAKQNKRGISRHARSTLRLARFLYEYGRASAANVHTIYAGMTFRHQSDKEFSLNGRITSSYMQHPRLIAPRLQIDPFFDLKPSCLSVMPSRISIIVSGPFVSSAVDEERREERSDGCKHAEH